MGRLRVDALLNVVGSFCGLQLDKIHVLLTMTWLCMSIIEGHLSAVAATCALSGLLAIQKGGTHVRYSTHHDKAEYSVMANRSSCHWCWSVITQHDKATRRSPLRSRW